MLFFWFTEVRRLLSSCASISQKHNETTKNKRNGSNYKDNNRNPFHNRIFFHTKRVIQDKTSTDYSFNYENQALFIFLLTFSCIRKTFSYILLVDLGDTPSDRWGKSRHSKNVVLQQRLDLSWANESATEIKLSR